jgi:hypothetical protein
MTESDPNRQLLVVALAREFNVITHEELTQVHAEFRLRHGMNAATYTELMLEMQLLGVEHANELHSLAELLETRHADRTFGTDAVDTGLVSEDEVDYAFSAQERQWKGDQETQGVGDFLVSFGSMDDELKAELLRQRGRT